MLNEGNIIARLSQYIDTLPTLLINNLIIIALFVCGIFVGTGIFWVVYLIATKRKPKLEKENSEVTDLEIFDEIIIPAQTAFVQAYAVAKIPEKFDGLKKATVNMVQEISKKYYPRSDYPVFEVSPDQLLKLVDKISDKMCRTLEKFLDENFVFRNAFKAGIYIHNKNKKDNMSYEWKELKLNTIKDIIEGMQKQEPQKEQKHFFEKVGATVLSLSSKLINNFINAKINELIKEIGQEINSVYGNKQSTVPVLKLCDNEIKEVK